MSLTNFLSMNNNRSSRIIWIWIWLGSLSVSFGFGVFFGSAIDLHETFLSGKRPVNITSVLNLYSKTRSGEADFDQFWYVWDRVKDKYVTQPVDDTDLFYGALAGIVQGLHDPHSSYFPPQDAEEFARDLSGELEGIGAEIGIKDDVIAVIAPLPGTPAERAGLLPGDKIIKINDEETYGMPLDKAVSKIRGPGGTSVTLTILPKDDGEFKDIAIRREKITIPTVIFEMKPEKIAYVRITYFNQETAREFGKVITKLETAKAKGVVLDLRSDPGGYLEAAIDVASAWISDGIIVTERGKDGVAQEHRTRGSHRLAEMPTVVLVDEGSASGSEIVAGALQDYGLATIVGMKTYGKGSVQDFEMLPDGSALKLTIAKWYTPKDRSIDGEGIAPDIVLEKMIEKKPVENPEDTPEIVDLGLEKALELLSKW